MNKEEIIAIRKALGLTQEQFASILGTTHTTVNRWENGKAKASRLYVKEIMRFKEPKINHDLHFKL